MPRQLGVVRRLMRLGVDELIDAPNESYNHQHDDHAPRNPRSDRVFAGFRRSVLRVNIGWLILSAGWIRHIKLVRTCRLYHMKPIAIYHEHPDWFRPLFAELDRRRVPYVKLDAAAHRYDPSETEVPYSLVFNRASPSAYLRGHAGSTFYTLQWLRHLARIGVPVVNGATAYAMDTSKAIQIDALADLGLAYPRTGIANSGATAV